MRKCVNCGKEAQEGASFCVHCGAELPVESPGNAPRKFNPRVPQFVAAIVVAAALGAVCAAVLPGLLQPKTARVSMQVVAPGYEEGDSDAPLKVKGKTKRGEEVDKTVYVSRSGGYVDVEPGDYYVTLIASPLCESRTIYETTESLELHVTENGLGEGDQIETAKLELQPVPEGELTKEQVEAAYEAAVEAGYDEGHASTLRQASLSTFVDDDEYPDETDPLVENDEDLDETDPLVDLEQNQAGGEGGETGGGSDNSVASRNPEDPDKATGEDEPITLDIAKSEDRGLVNELISGVAETGTIHEATDFRKCDPQQLAATCVYYIGLHDRNLIENGEYTHIAGSGGGAQGVSNERVPMGKVQEVAQKLFDIELDPKDFSDKDDGYTCVDDFLYFGVTAPFSQSPSYATGTKIMDLGEGLFRVELEYYSTGYPYGMRADQTEFDPAKDLYPLSAQDARKLLHVDDAFARGSAVIEAKREDGEVKVCLRELGEAKYVGEEDLQPDDATPAEEGSQLDDATLVEEDGLYSWESREPGTPEDAESFGHAVIEGDLLTIYGVTNRNVEGSGAIDERPYKREPLPGNVHSFKLTDDTEFRLFNENEDLLVSKDEFAQMLENNAMTGPFPGLTIKVEDGVAISAFDCMPFD